MLPRVRKQVDTLFKGIMRGIFPRLMCMLLGVMALGCDISSDDQRCIPLSQSGCARGEVCTIDADGAPICVIAAASPLREGAECRAPSREREADEPSECAAGLACIHHQGVDRCLRFCNPNVDVNQSTCRTARVDGDDIGHPFFESSRCDLVLDGRPDIAVCSLPCDPNESIEFDCPSAHRCAIAPGAQTARCQLDGLGRLGQRCGASCRCGDGLQCVAEGDDFVCRAFTQSGACNEGIPSPIVGSLNPLDDNVPYRICRPCHMLNLNNLSLCETPAVCSGDYGVLGTLSAQDLRAVADRVFRLSSTGTQVIVGAELRDGQGWFWRNADAPIPSDLWEGDVNPSTGECVVLGPSGLLSTSMECDGQSLCEPTTRPNCGA